MENHLEVDNVRSLTVTITFQINLRPKSSVYLGKTLDGHVEEKLIHISGCTVSTIDHHL